MLRPVTVNTSCRLIHIQKKKKKKTHEKGKLQAIVKNVVQYWVNKYLHIYLYKCSMYLER